MQRDYIRQASGWVGNTDGDEAGMDKFPHEAADPWMRVEELAIVLHLLNVLKDYGAKEVISSAG